jgi:RND superfamily putative drug exporter
VFIDATVVRVVVGPALLQLAGDWNWWPFGLHGAPATSEKDLSYDDEHRECSSDSTGPRNSLTK